MVCSAVPTSVTPEVAGLIAKKPLYRDGLREIGALLPESDTDLHEWMMQAVSRADENTFVYLLFAAAITNRKLEASLLPFAMAFRPAPWNLAWIAWHMEGNVTEELLRGLEQAVPQNMTCAFALFVG